jgi:spore germination cell wall hydrolase CwlJ-like protein
MFASCSNTILQSKENETGQWPHRQGVGEERGLSFFILPRSTDTSFFGTLFCVFLWRKGNDKMSHSRTYSFVFGILSTFFFLSCSTTTLVTPVGNLTYEPSLSPVFALDSVGQEVGIGINKSLVMTGDSIYVNTDQNLKNLDQVAERFLPEPPEPEDIEDMESTEAAFHSSRRKNISVKMIQNEDEQVAPEDYLPGAVSSLVKQKELTLLAMCIYGEARSEPYDGKLSVAYVAINRVKEKSWYGRTLKEVLLKPYQFSCFNRNDPNFKKLFKPKPDIWKRCFKAAWNAYSELSEDPTLGSNHYCRHDITPPWLKVMEMKTQIGNHVFFKTSPQAVMEWWYAHLHETWNPNSILLNHSVREEWMKFQFLINENTPATQAGSATDLL